MTTEGRNGVTFQVRSLALLFYPTRSQMFLAYLYTMVSQNNFLPGSLYLCSLQRSKRISFQWLPFSWTFCIPEIERGCGQLILYPVNCPSREGQAADTEAYIRPSTWGTVPGAWQKQECARQGLTAVLAYFSLPCERLPAQSGSLNLLLFLLQLWLLFY